MSERIKAGDLIWYYPVLDSAARRLAGVVDSEMLEVAGHRCWHVRTLEPGGQLRCTFYGVWSLALEPREVTS